MDGTQPDGLDILIQHSIDHDPGFAEVWAPYALMGRLIDERNRLGLSQRDLATRMGIAQPSVARMEARPDGVALARILAYAKALGVELVVKPSKEKPASSVRGRRASSTKAAA